MLSISYQKVNSYTCTFFCYSTVETLFSFLVAILLKKDKVHIRNRKETKFVLFTSKNNLLQINNGLIMINFANTPTTTKKTIIYNIPVITWNENLNSLFLYMLTCQLIIVFTKKKTAFVYSIKKVFLVYTQEWKKWYKQTLLFILCVISVNIEMLHCID